MGGNRSEEQNNPGTRAGTTDLGHGHGGSARPGWHNETRLPADFHDGWAELIFLLLDCAFWALDKGR